VLLKLSGSAVTVRLLLVCVLTLATPSQAQPKAYPAREILAAFSQACMEVRDPTANLAAVKSAGWKEVSLDASTPILRAIESSGGSLDSNTEYEHLFRKRVAGRKLYALLSFTTYGGSLSGRTRECSVHDFKANRALTKLELETWLDRSIDKIETEEDGTIQAEFEGFGANRLDVFVVFRPQISAVQNSFYGLILETSAYSR
jgi:hypothetical protein